MPTLATGISVSNTLRAARARSAGFTLHRAHDRGVHHRPHHRGAPSSPSAATRRDTELDKEAQRLDALFDYAREQAELQTRDYGFRVNDLAYSFVVFDVLQNQWRAADEDDALREREFPEGIEPAGRASKDGRIVLDQKKRDHRRLQAAGHDLRQRRPVVVRNHAAARRWRRSRRASTPTNRPTIRLLLPGEIEAASDRRCARRNADDIDRGTTRVHAARGADRARHRRDVGRRAAGHGHLLRQQRHLSQGQDAGRMGGAQSAHGGPHRQAHARQGQTQRQHRHGAACAGNGKRKSSSCRSKGMLRIEVRAHPTGEFVDDTRPTEKPTAQKLTPEHRERHVARQGRLDHRR